MRKYLTAVLVVAACGAVLKPPEPDRRLELHEHGSIFESSNGYRIAVLPQAGARVLRIDVRYPVGSVDDPPGKQGLAHLVEHLLFDVEIRRDDAKTSISAELDRLALYHNAETTADYTDYEVDARPEVLGEIIELEAERLAAGCGGLTPAIFQHEREVVMEELRERRGAAGDELLRLITEAAYPPGHPYRAVDSVESVAALDYKDVCDFLAGPYRRGIATIVISGAVTDAAVRAAVEAHLTGLHPRQPMHRVAIPTVQASPGRSNVRGNVEHPMLIATWPLPPSATREARLLELALDSLGARMEDYAFENDLGASGFSFTLGGGSAPVLALAVELSSSKKLDDAIESIGKVIEWSERALGHESKTYEWQVIWQAHAESLLARWDSLGDRNDMVSEMLSTGAADTLTSRVSELVAAIPNDVRALVENWLAPERAHYVLIEPDGAPHALGKHAVQRGAEEHAAMVDGSLADKPLPAPDPAPLAPMRYTLDNGLSVVLLPEGSTPLVHGRLVVGAGTALDPAGAEGVASVEGASEVYEDHIVYSDRQLSTRVDELVDNLTLELRFPGYALSDSQKSYLKARLRERHVKERLGFDRDLAAALYGAGHPYARVGMTEASVDKIHRDMTVGWARRYVVPANSTLIITGHFDPELVKKYIAHDVGHVASGDAAGAVGASVASPKRYVSGTTETPSPTIELGLAFRTRGGLDASYGERLVLEKVLDAKLAALRAKQALTYGFYASFEPQLAGGAWSIAGDADATRAREAATALLQALADLRKDPESYRDAFVIARQKVIEQLRVIRLERVVGGQRARADRTVSSAGLLLR